MGYEINLSCLSLMEYKEILKKYGLIAGRRILKDAIDEKFERLFGYGINNIAQLAEHMGSPQRLEELAAGTGLQLEYLMVLKREIASIVQKPVLISDFPYISQELFEKLAENGIETSRDFYEISGGCKDKRAICEKTGISEYAALELCSLCDLIRINGVGPVLARVLFEAGFKGVCDIAAGDTEDILEKISEINDACNYTRVRPDRKEIQFCIEYARLIK